MNIDGWFIISAIYFVKTGQWDQNGYNDRFPLPEFAKVN
jgi:hypothetical protein